MIVTKLDRIKIALARVYPEFMPLELLCKIVNNTPASISGLIRSQEGFERREVNGRTELRFHYDFQ